MKEKSGAEKINPYNDTESKTEQVEEMFDSIASAYDFMNTAMTFGLHRYWRNRAIKRLENLPHQKILDVATGTGDVAFKIYDKLRPDSITGVDLSSGMLDVARKKLAESPDDEMRRRILFEEGDCLNLKYADKEFDIVTTAYGVRNFEHLDKGYAEMLRVLKPGGTLCVIELSVPRNALMRCLYNFYSRRLIPAIGRMVSGDARAYSYLPESIAACPQREQMISLMQQAGFEECRYFSLTFGTVCIYLAKAPTQ